MDRPGWLCLCRRLERALYCVTVHVGGIRFLCPILIGHLVEVTARLIRTGRTSVPLAITVRAREPREGGLIETPHGTVVFVAVSSTDIPVPVHSWLPETAKEIP